MNKTAFVLALVAVATLLPWPTTTAYKTPDCLPPVSVTVQKTVGVQHGTIPSLKPSAKQANSSPPPCTELTDCEALVHSLDINTNIDACHPSVQICPPGKLGVSVNGIQACVNSKVLGDCPNLDCLPPVVLPPVPRVPGSDTGRDPSCSKYEDEHGFGGTHMKCYYACRAGDAIGLVVQSTDKDASTYGSTTCANAHAGCALPAPSCADISKGLATRAAEDQECLGNTDEAWDSPAEVACYAFGMSTLCEIAVLKNLEPCHPTLAVNPWALCLGSNPWLGLDPLADASMVANAPPGLTSMVAFRVAHGQSLAIRIDQVRDADGNTDFVCAADHFDT